MKKLIELVINEDSLMELGVDAIALVENPAIELDFLYFNKEEFVRPTAGEDEGEFIGRCMSDLSTEFPDEDQRLAVCYSYYYEGDEEFKDLSDACWPGYEAIGKKPGKGGRMVPNCVKMDTEDFVKNKNPKGVGTAKGEATNTRSAKVSKGAEETLQKKSDEFNEKNKDKLGYGVDVGMLKAVYQRGLGAFNTSSRSNVKSAEQWAQARVNAFLYLVKAGRPENKNYKQDNDLLPKKHPKSDESQKMAMMFESYNDYPESAKNAAKRALEYRDKNPDHGCGTPVGWARANQLAKGENISEETIARMASFARHLQYKDVPYSEGCGGLMVDAWGGEAGIEWASNKLDSIRTELQDEPEINVLGYNTKHFKMCPRVTATFEHLVSMNPDEEVAGMIRSAAIQADTVLGIKQRVLDDGIATMEDLYEATLIVKDFFDLMAEIDTLVGMEHNIDYMYNHLDIIGNLVPDEDFAIDTAGLPVYVDEITEDKKKKDDLITVAILGAAARLGFSFETFANAQIAPNIGDSNNIEELQEYAGKDSGFTIYKYEGPSPQRQFCTQMMRLNRWYTYQDVKEMESIAVNAGFGAGGSSTYSIWKYKGGVNCKHRWQKYYVNVTDNKLENKGPALGLAGERANDSNNNYRMSNAYHFAEDKRIVTGPLMVPNMEIARKADDGSKYFVYFTEDTIRKIAEKFAREKKLDRTNIEHDSEDIRDQNYLFETWIVEDAEMDKAKALGFNVPKGTWMGSMRVMDDTTWNMVKDGKIKGFSVEGFFGEMSPAKEDEDLYNQVRNLVASWNGQ